MKHLRPLLLLLAATLLAWSWFGARARAANADFQVAVPRGVAVSTLVAPPGDSPAIAWTKLAFDIDPDGLPVYADGSSLRVFGSPKPLATTGSSPIDDFAWMRDGSLLLIAQNHLAGFGPHGIALGPQLPAPGMHVRPAGEGRAYVFGGAGEPANHDVYLFGRDGRIAKLLSAPEPVVAVAGDGSTTYVAAGRTLLRLRAGKSVKLLLRTRAPIISIDAAPPGVFYATAASVGYLSSDGAAHDFLRGEGGLLRVQGEALFLMLRDGKHLIRFNPIAGFASGLGKGAAPH